jgi:hypothetical protein
MLAQCIRELLPQADIRGNLGGDGLALPKVEGIMLYLCIEKFGESLYIGLL